MNDNVNLNLYKIFYYVATLKSFNAAAEKLYISQPAISKQIKKLESILDVKLFNRLSKSIELTKEGEILFEQVEKIFFYLEVSNKNLLLAKDLMMGEIVIGCPSHITSFYLLDYIKRFKKDYPQIVIKVDSSSTTELVDKLKHHKIDFIIDSLPIDINNLEFSMEPLKTIDTTFIISNEANIKNFDLSEMEKYYFILPPEKSSMRKSLNKVLQKQHIRLNASLYVETTDLIINAVKDNLGIGYVIKDAVTEEIRSNKIVELKLNFELPKLELNLVYPNDYLSYPSKTFLEKYIRKF